MLEFELYKDKGVLVIKPHGPLCVDDFTAVTNEVDPYIEAARDLQGVMIDAESLPGWEDFASLTAHLKFVRDHHKHIRKLAIVSDSKVLTVMPKIAGHFVSAEVRHFDSGDRDAAEAWLEV